MRKPAVVGVAEPPAAGESLLVERARAGDLAAREQLVSQYVEDVFRLAHRILGDRELAEDATQDAFLNALRSLDRFRGHSSFRTWLLRIAVNASRTIGRRQVRRREVALAAAEREASPTPDPATRAEHSAEARRVEAALQRLPERQRLTVSLRIQGGLSYAEIAYALDSTEGAARVNYHLGIKRLREMLT